MSEHVGTIIAGRYTVDKMIGRGGMADVYHGTDTVLQREVAIKLLTDRSEVVRKRFLREAQSMAHLNHPNIVSVYDAGEDGEQLYIIMELIHGKTLKDALHEGLAYPRALEVFVDLLEALDYAHKNSVIHRDIKPGNVMLLDDGNVKVMDFGLSRRVSDASDVTQAGEIVGTIAYLSPERFLGRNTDQRSDLYSVGCLMYEIFTGDVPFKSPSEDLVSVIFAHVNEPPTPPRNKNPNLPAGLERIILKLLEKDPADRYATAADVLSDLRQMQNHPTGAPAATVQPPASPGHPPTPAPRDLKSLLGNAIEAQRSGNVDAVKSMLNHAFRPAEQLREAQKNVLVAMLAERKKDYADAARAYKAALEGFKAVDNELEYARAALRYAGMNVERHAGGQSIDGDETDNVIRVLSEAVALLRSLHLTNEVDHGERLLYALRRIRVGTQN